MQTLFRFLIFHLLLSLGHNALGSTIINGKKVPDELMLYMVSLQNSFKQHICGGFLIKEDFVLTAAHCDRKNLTVVLGTHNLKKVDNSMRYRVRSYKNPHFCDAKYGNDIMLLELLNKTRLDKRKQLIRIPKNASNLKAKTKCRVAGWGFTSTGRNRSNILEVVDVPVVKLDECRQQWKEWGNLELPKDVICAGGSDTKNGFCKGDSGGPLVCGGEAVGIVSFNMDENCDYPNIANVYIDISKHLNWIKKILAKRT